MPPQAPPVECVNFTRTSGNVICQRCKVSYPEGEELHFLHDATGEGPGKHVCNGCRQYYIIKTRTEMANHSSASSKLLIRCGLHHHTVLTTIPGQPSFSRQVTPGRLATDAQQNIRKAVAAAQREGMTKRVIPCKKLKLMLRRSEPPSSNG